MMNYWPPRGDGLVAAAWQGNVELVRGLIQAGADVNQVDMDGASALMNAIGSKDASDLAKLEIVKLLVEVGCDVNYRDPEDDSAIALAASEAAPEILEYLLAHGANLQITAFRSESILDGAKIAQSLERSDAEPGWCDEATASEHQRKATAIARNIEILKRHGAKSFWKLDAEKVGRWIRITSRCKTGILTDSGHLTVEQLPGVNKELCDEFHRWFQDAVATRVAADRSLTPPNFNRDAHNATGWRLAQTIKKLVSPDVEVEVIVVYDSEGGGRSGGYKTVSDT